MHNSSKTIIILGMHRSGTSCLAGSLQENGVYLGDVHTYNNHNAKGNREHSTIVELNDAVLASNNTTWDSPPPKAINCRDKQLITTRSLFISHIEKEALERQAMYWGFKDPRALFTLPFWQDGISDIQLVGTFRHPLSVALSLYNRDKMPIKEGLRLWEKYNVAFLKHYEASPFPLVCFDVPDEEYLFSLQLLYQELSIGYTAIKQSFFDDDLRKNSESSIKYPLPISIQRLHSKLLDIYRSQQPDNLTLGY